MHVPVDVGQLSSDLTKYKAMLLPVYDHCRRTSERDFGNICGKWRHSDTYPILRTTGTRATEWFRKLCPVSFVIWRELLWRHSIIWRSIASFHEIWKYSYLEGGNPDSKRVFIDACGESRGFVSVNSYGKGCVYYISAVFREYDCLLTDIFAREQIKCGSSGGGGGSQ